MTVWARRGDPVVSADRESLLGWFADDAPCVGGRIVVETGCSWNRGHRFIHIEPEYASPAARVWRCATTPVFDSDFARPALLRANPYGAFSPAAQKEASR